MNKHRLDRREFLKLVGLAGSALLFPQLDSRVTKLQSDESRPNIIILLFDAMSARNLSLYGYPRATSPNLNRFADRSIVYHSHYSGGNYTVPGTSTLLTGTYPWTHRAINYHGQIKRELIGNNIFRAIGDEYYRVAFGQNEWANFILTQFADDIDTLLAPDAYGELNYLLGKYFPNDKNIASRALDDFVLKMDRKPASILLGTLQTSLYFRSTSILNQDGYPMGIPYNAEYPIYFRMENLFDGLASLILDLPSPSFAYLHLFPPHFPYRASDRFFGEFVDGWSPVHKPISRFGPGLLDRDLKDSRRSYDEYVVTLDWEFGKLFDTLEKNGVFENSYVIVTSDHGEMFERGERAHSTPLLYDPVVHIPLMISVPGSQNRRDVYSPTHAVDVMPTLLQLAGKPFPAWGEGKLLPELGGLEDRGRSLFVVEAKNNSAFHALKKTTLVIRKDNYKLIYYKGYEAEDSFELYDLNTDIEELNDLYLLQPAIAKTLREELMDSLSDANKPFLA